MAISPVGGPYGICIPRFRNLGEKNSEFAGGYGIAGAMQRTSYNGIAGWHLISLIEVLPRWENYVQFQDDVDAWGIKTIAVRLSYADNKRKIGIDADNSIREVVDAAGLNVKVRETSVPGSFAHELGGARMGDSPRTSVLTPFCQCWDAANFFVTDGSCFVTAGWQNPSLTMMAITVRSCDFIIGELKRGNL